MTATTTPKARPGAFAEKLVKALLAGKRTSAVAGFSHGLDQAEARRITQAIVDAIEGSGGTVVRWAPATRHQRDRLMAAYANRGLKPDPTAYPDSLYDERGRLR
jgi:hypothetical protein